MKSVRSYIYSFLYLVAIVGTMHGSQCHVTPAGNRIWDIISATSPLLLTIQSSLGVLNSTIAQSSVGTFTTLNAIINTNSSIVSLLQTGLTLTNTSDAKLSQINSLIDITNRSINTSATFADTIHLVDFPGTWTLINAIKNTTNVSFSTIDSLLITVESKLSAFSEQALIEYIATFTSILDIGAEALNTLTLIEAINDTVLSQVNAINTQLVNLNNNTQTISSEAVTLNVATQTGFLGTYTALQRAINMTKTINSHADIITHLVAVDTIATVTTLNFIAQQTYTVLSKTNYLNSSINTLESTVFTISSKSSVLQARLYTIDSLLDVVQVIDSTNSSLMGFANSELNVIQSKISTLNVNTIISKTSVINSKIDTINTSLINVISTQLDGLIGTNALVKSEIDVSNALLNNSVLVSSTINSKVATLNTNLITVNSKVNFFSSYLDIESSKLDIINQLALATLPEISVASSLMDQISATLLDINVLSLSQIAQLAVIIQSGSTLDSLIDNIAFKSISVGSFVDIADTAIRISTDLARTSMSEADTISSKLDVANQSASILDGLMNVLVYDFQQTWTIIESLQTRAVSINSTLNATSTALTTVNTAVDLSTTYTALNALNSNVLTLQNQINTAISSIRCISQEDLNGTYSMLNAITGVANRMLFTASSQLNVIPVILDATYGTTLGQLDIGTTGTTLSSSGSYYLGENIVFNPLTTGRAAITIGNNNILLNLSGRTLSQGNRTSSTVGVRVQSPFDNVTITDGTIRNFTGNGIELQSGTSQIVITDMNIMNAGQHGMALLTTSSHVQIEDCMIGGCVGDGLNASSSTNMYVCNSMFTDNGTTSTNNGVTISNCNNVTFDNCLSTTNNGNGYSFISTSTSVSFLLQDCKAFANQSAGIRIGQLFSSLVTNCVCAENGSYGIQLVDCQNVNVQNNYCMANALDGIILDRTSVGTKNCIIQQNSLLLTGSVNIREAAGSGSNSIFANFALSNSGGNNFATLSRRTFLNFLTISQRGGVANIANLVKWYNISMTT